MDHVYLNLEPGEIQEMMQEEHQETVNGVIREAVKEHQVIHLRTLTILTILMLGKRIEMEGEMLVIQEVALLLLVVMGHSQIQNIWINKMKRKRK